MNIKLFYSASLVLFIVFVACTFKHRATPVDEKLLPGKYCHNYDPRDSIFVYTDKTYKHTYHRSDGIVHSQTNKWRYESDVNHIFFESFLFFIDGVNVDTADYKGSWPSKVFVTEEGQVKLRYSESVYFVMANGK
jgi:hypothetical protein